jgi:hypothetical protein
MTSAFLTFDQVRFVSFAHALFLIRTLFLLLYIVHDSVMMVVYCSFTDRRERRVR